MGERIDNAFIAIGIQFHILYSSVNSTNVIYFKYFFFCISEEVEKSGNPNTSARGNYTVNINIEGCESIITGSVDNICVLNKRIVTRESDHLVRSSSAISGRRNNNFHWSDWSRESQCAFQHVTRRRSDFLVKRCLPRDMFSDVYNAYSLEEELIKAPSVERFLKSLEDRERYFFVIYQYVPIKTGTAFFNLLNCCPRE